MVLNGSSRVRINFWNSSTVRLRGFRIILLAPESPDSLLLRSHQMAKSLLPQLLRDLQIKQSAPAETSFERFVKDESAFDPFLENANLTRDAYAGRGEVEPEKPVRLDGFGNCVRE
jgi:hypothetical protein